MVTYLGTDFVLAHNYLAGEMFYDLRPGDRVTVLYADSEQYYKVSRVIVQPHMEIYVDDIRDGIYLVTCWPRLGKSIGRILVELQYFRPDTTVN